MNLKDLVRAYIAAQNLDRHLGRELSAKTCEHLFECVRVYSKHLLRPATTDDLTSGAVTEFLKALLADEYSAYTVKNRRTGLLALWRYAFRKGLTLLPCADVRPVYCPPLMVAGYDLANMDKILNYISTLRGVVRTSGVKKTIYWDSFLRTDWELGLRIGDMVCVRVEHFDPTGWLWFSESKTAKAGWRCLRPSTTESIATCIAANPGRERIWPGFTRKNACRAFSELAKLAGVNGTSKYIRSGGSSECDKLYPGTGWKHLRHSSPAVWDKHYKVDRICEAGRPMPPELGRAG